MASAWTGAQICFPSVWSFMRWQQASCHSASRRPNGAGLKEKRQGSVFDSILNRIPVSPVRLNPDVPAELERIIGKCLEKDRELRYQHASEIRADLQSLLRDFDAVNSRPGVRSPARTRHTKTVAGISLAVAAACGAGYFYFDRAPELVGKIPLVVAEFKSNTSDACFRRKPAPESARALRNSRRSK